jgi:HD superfamily phosphohydrolase
MQDLIRGKPSRHWRVNPITFTSKCVQEVPFEVDIRDYQCPAWVFEIVSNDKYQFDVDKCDYLRRDLYYLNLGGNLQIERIFKHAKIIRDTICFHVKVAQQLVGKKVQNTVISHFARNNKFYCVFELFKD